MQNDSLDWGPEHEETKQDVDAALAKVRRTGERKKAQRRAASGVVAVVAVLGLFAGVAVTGNDGSKSPQMAGPSTTEVPVTEVPLSLASRVTKVATDSLAQLKSISATERTTTHELFLDDYTSVAGTETAKYRIAENGSFWQSTDRRMTRGYSEIDDTSYSATSGKYTKCLRPSSGEAQCNTNWGPIAPYTQLSQFIAATNNAQRGQNLFATEVVRDGSKTWVLEYDSNPVLSDARLHVKLTVDQATGLPVRLERTVNGQPDMESEITEISVNPTLKDADMHVAIPNGLAITDFTKPQPSSPEKVTTFGAGTTGVLVGQLPVSNIEHYNTKEVWSTVGARGFDSYDCLAADKGIGRHVMQTSRHGFLTYWTTTLDLSTCQGALDASDLMADYNHSRKVQTIVAVDGALKGMSFDVYAQPDRSLFVVGRDQKTLTFSEGHLTLDDVSSLVNGYTR